MERVSFFLNDVLDDVAERLARDVDEGIAGDVLSVAEEVPRHLTGDPDSLGQILIDLAECALAYPGSGAVVAEVGLIGRRPDVARRSVALCFALRGNGAGLTFDKAVGILAQYLSGGAREGTAAGPDRRGAAAELLENLGGSIGIASEPQQGFAITFTGEFGMQNHAADDAADHSVGVARHHPKAEIKMPEGLEQIWNARILLAEDHPVNQNLTQEILAQAGCKVDVAEDGRATVSAVRNSRKPYHAVLMDVQMPVMDGFEATRQIREHFSETELPIIAMTANVLGDERERCLAAGMNDYVPKPIHIPDLYAALIRWVRLDETGQQPAPEEAVPVEPAVAEPDGPEVSLPERIAEIDVEAGLARAMGNRELYAGLLIQFRQTNESLGADVAASIAKGDLELARFLVHGLASTAGNIGAESVYSSANELEKAIVGGRTDDIADLLAAFEECLEKALDGIRRSGVSVKDRPARLGNGSAPLDPAGAADLADRLGALLEDQDMAAAGQLDALLEILGGRGQDEKLERLKASLEGLEFREAREILADICKELLD